MNNGRHKREFLAEMEESLLWEERLSGPDYPSILEVQPGMAEMRRAVFKQSSAPRRI